MPDGGPAPPRLEADDLTKALYRAYAEASDAGHASAKRLRNVLLNQLHHNCAVDV